MTRHSSSIGVAPQQARRASKRHVGCFQHISKRANWATFTLVVTRHTSSRRKIFSVVTLWTRLAPAYITIVSEISSFTINAGVIFSLVLSRIAASASFRTLRQCCKTLKAVINPSLDKIISIFCTFPTTESCCVSRCVIPTFWTDGAKGWVGWRVGLKVAWLACGTGCIAVNFKVTRVTGGRLAQKQLQESRQNEKLR